MKLIGFTLTAILSSALFASACVAPEEEVNYDQAELEAARRAIPTRARLEASATEASTATAFGDPAIYPHASAELVFGVNGAVIFTTTLLDAVTTLPPTVYNSQTKEFVWGPFPDDSGIGYWAAYIKDTEGAGDFRYEYAFLRGMGNDLATLTPIIYGGGTPDESNDDYGVGVTLWDMTASRDFDAQNNPNHDASQFDEGRFAALFAAGPDENDPDNEVAIVVAAFRDFIGKDSEDGLPSDLDYLYGHVNAPTHNVDFVDFQLNTDVSEPKDGLQENVGVRMAFLNSGIGRAEADAYNGTLVSGQRYDVTECWDTSLNQTFLLGEMSENGTATETVSEGEVSNCGFIFSNSLDDLGVPRLEDVDAELLNALDQAASNGL